MQMNPFLYMGTTHGYVWSDNNKKKEKGNEEKKRSFYNNNNDSDRDNVFWVSVRPMRWMVWKGPNVSRYFFLKVSRDVLLNVKDNLAIKIISLRS